MVKITTIKTHAEVGYRSKWSASAITSIVQCTNGFVPDIHQVFVVYVVGDTLNGCGSAVYDIPELFVLDVTSDIQDALRYLECL
jgi:hypothetical protein